MKLLVLMFIGIIQFSEEKPTEIPETTTTGSTLVESSIVTEFLATLEPKDEAKISSSSEKAGKNSSEVDKPPKDVQLPVDLLSDDILLDPSVILARAERSLSSSDTGEIFGPIINDPLDIGQFEDDTPTFYYLKFVRVPRSAVESDFETSAQDAVPEEPDVARRRHSRNAANEDADDLIGAHGSFAVRPLFKYRHEQLKRSNRRGYRNRDTYSFYPRYPVFPGK